MRGTAVPGGRQERLPGTLSRGFRGRWTANLSDTGRDSAMKMKIMENLLLFVVNSYFRREKNGSMQTMDETGTEGITFLDSTRDFH